MNANELRESTEFATHEVVAIASETHKRKVHERKEDEKTSRSLAQSEPSIWGTAGLDLAALNMFSRDNGIRLFEIFEPRKPKKKK